MVAAMIDQENTQADIRLADCDEPAALPALAADHATITENLEAFRTFCRAQMKSGEDYGVIPGTGAKPSLLKPGAEKLLTYHGFGWHLSRTEQSQIRWDPKDPLLVYEWTCRVFVKSTGATVVDGITGLATSFEDKWRYRWVPEKSLPAGVDPASLPKRGGKYGPTYRVDVGGDVLGQANTISKIAQKRALVSAALAACRASGVFTQDLEDIQANERARTGDSQPQGKPAYAGKASSTAEMSEKQRSMIKSLCDEQSLAGGDIDAWCSSKLGKHYVQKIDGEWKYQLTKKEASTLIDALMEKKVPSAALAEYETDQSEESSGGIPSSEASVF